MIQKTREELKNELELKNALEIEREISNKSYALKIVEKIVFSAIGIIAVGFLSALIYLVWHIK